MSAIVKKLTTGSTEGKKLIKTMNQFISWLVTKKIVKGLPQIVHIVDFPFANEDWTMRVDEEKHEVAFNTIIRDKCTFEYYQVVVLHELFHLIVQKVPNKEDAARVKDDFGDQLMKLIDIEADFFTALFHKEQLDYSLVGYLKLYHEGNTVFSDRRIRAIKLERFIGTLLSISKMFLNSTNKASKEFVADLYLPTISPIYTESSLHVLVVRKEHIYFDEIKAEYSDFVKVKDCYTNIDTWTVKGYVEKLIEFVCKALNKPIPEDVKSEIKNLNN